MMLLNIAYCLVDLSCWLGEGESMDYGIDGWGTGFMEWGGGGGGGGVYGK
jgi:hypothetical protein